MASKQVKQQERDEAIAELRKLLKPGDRVCTILRHVSNSGMLRVIDLAIPVREYKTEYPLKSDPEYPGQRDYDAKGKRKFVGLRIRNLGYLAALAMGDRWDRDRQGIRVGGCGMDMGFHLIYSLGRTLWPKGTPKPHGRRNGEDDSEGGYALKHEWL